MDVRTEPFVHIRCKEHDHFVVVVVYLAGIERLEDERKDREAERQRQEQAAREAGEHVAGRRERSFCRDIEDLVSLDFLIPQMPLEERVRADFSFVVSAYDICIPSDLEAVRQESHLLCCCRGLAAVVWRQRPAGAECSGC